MKNLFATFFIFFIAVNLFANETPKTQVRVDEFQISVNTTGNDSLELFRKLDMVAVAENIYPIGSYLRKSFDAEFFSIYCTSKEVTAETSQCMIALSLKGLSSPITSETKSFRSVLVEKDSEFLMKTLKVPAMAEAHPGSGSFIRKSFTTEDGVFQIECVETKGKASCTIIIEAIKMLLTKTLLFTLKH